MILSPFRSRRIAAKLLLTLALVCLGQSASSQQSPESPASTDEKTQERVSPKVEKAASEAELAALRQQLEQATARQKLLASEIEALDKDRGSINRALIVSAKRAQELETEIARQEKKLGELALTRKTLRNSLLSKRALMAEVLAALQRMGRNPPPAILVRPEDALASIRSAILLGAVVPEIRSETATLLAELKALTEITRQINLQKVTLAKDLNALAEDESRLTLLVKEKSKLADRSRQQLLAEQQKSAKLAGQANSLEELINQIEQQIASAAKAAAAAKLADERRRTAEQERLAKAREAIARGEIQRGQDPEVPAIRLDAKFADSARLEPAIAFSKAKGLLPLPVSGKVVHLFGSSAPNGLTRPNLALATRANSRVRSPADGWVVYAGPFRSYGQLLILNTGDDHHVVLSGMSSVNVNPGQFILAGEPVGRMGLTRVAAASALDLSSAQPVLYVEFRKDGKSIDPSPWWAKKDTKRLENDS